MATTNSTAAQQPVITLNAESQLQFIKEMSSKFEAAQCKVYYMPTFLLSDLEAIGYKYSSLSFGRDIDVKHTNDLYKDLIKSGKKVFTKKAIAIPVKSILEANENLGTSVKVYDEAGQELSLQTPEIDSYLVYLDGNHRWFVHRIHPEIDMVVELSVVEDPFLFMADYNKLSKNWGIEDWVNANISTGKIEGAIHSTFKDIQNRLGVSLKWANYMLTRDRECVKKSDLELGKDTTTNNPAFIERGKLIAGAIALAFPKPGKDATEMSKTLYKSVRTIQYVDAIEFTDKAAPSPEFGKQFAAFVLLMTEPEKEGLYHRFVEKDYAGVKKYVYACYSAFVKTHEAEMEAFINSAASKIGLEFDTATTSIDKPQVIKSGTAQEILESMSFVEEYHKTKKAQEDAQNNADAAKKKLEKAEADLGTAMEKLVEADDNLKTAAPKHQESAEKKLQNAQAKVEQAQEALNVAKLNFKAAQKKLEEFSAVES